MAFSHSDSDEVISDLDVFTRGANARVFTVHSCSLRGQYFFFLDFKDRSVTPSLPMGDT